MNMTTTFNRQPLNFKTRTDKKFKGKSRNIKATTIYSPASPSNFKTSPKAFRTTQQIPKKVDQSIQQNTTTNFSMSTRQREQTNTDDISKGQMRSKRSVASLLKRSGDGHSPIKHSPSKATIQTAFGPTGEPRLSISEYVNEHVSLLESTKVKVAAKRKKRQSRLENQSARNDESPVIEKEKGEKAKDIDDFNATLQLPDILKQESETGRHLVIRNRRDTMALVDSQGNDSSSMMDLGSIQQP